MSKISDWFHHAEQVIANTFHSLISSIEPSLHDLDYKLKAAFVGVLAQAGKDVASAASEAEAQGKSLTSKDVVTSLIGTAVKSVADNAMSVGVPLLETTAHSIGAQVVAQTLNLQPVDYSKLNN